MELFLIAGLWLTPSPAQISFELDCRSVQAIVGRLIRNDSVSQAMKIEIYRELKEVTPASCQVEVLT